MRTSTTVKLSILCAIAFAAALGGARAQEAAAPAAPPAASPAVPAAAGPQPAQHELPIVEVVVYEDRALVTREGDVPLKGGGVETVVLGGLAPALSETSIRSGLAESSRGRVISVSSALERRREIQDTKLRAAEEEKRGVERRIAEVDDELKALATREAYVAAYEKLV
ncbi:MAG: DUF4140 domain-containing protein, partial [Planctomycetes bacterium]|nr:DUF4140 domain-containing protein [Planctomycetota bacterium]